MARKSAFANPFFVLLLLVSTLFVVTALAYAVSGVLLVPPTGAGGAKPGAGSLALAHWLDRRGPRTLGVEIAVMLVSGVLAMATDSWFARKKGTQ